MCTACWGVQGVLQVFVTQSWWNLNDHAVWQQLFAVATGWGPTHLGSIETMPTYSWLWADFLCRKFFYVHFYVKHRDKICCKSDDFCITLLVGSFAAPKKQFIPNINHQLLWHPFNSLNWKFGFDRFYIYGDINHLRQWLFLGSNYFGTSARYKGHQFLNDEPIFSTKTNPRMPIKPYQTLKTRKMQAYKRASKDCCQRIWLTIV